MKKMLKDHSFSFLQKSIVSLTYLLDLNGVMEPNAVGNEHFHDYF